jgi:hypothetical protein
VGTCDYATTRVCNCADERGIISDLRPQEQGAQQQYEITDERFLHGRLLIDPGMDRVTQ